MKKNVAQDSVTNGAESLICMGTPYVAVVTIEGICDYLFHRWNCETVDEKSKLAKGSKGKKVDDLESFVYRNEDGYLCIPSEHLRMSIVNAAKFRQDPRSPRKSAMDMYKAGVIVLNPLASLGLKNWDYEDKRRVVIQRNSVNRTRPAISMGWKCEFQIQINLPEYISPQDLHDVLSTAGKLIGIGDFRPTYGRFLVKRFEIY